MELNMANAQDDNLAWLIKVGQIKDTNTPAPITTKDEE